MKMSRKMYNICKIKKITKHSDNKNFYTTTNINVRYLH